MADEYLTAALYGMKRFNEGASKKVKELMGMEKLVELLNEYETPQSGIVFKSYDDYDGTFYGVDCDGETEIAWSDSFICGKRFGFIKWLVENEKIDYEKIEEQTKCKNIVGGQEFLDFDIERDFTPYEEVLMWLAIQDEPIEFLVSILK